MPDTITVNLECTKCGSTNVVVPQNASEGDWITCDSCGEQLATVGQLNDHIAKQVATTFATGLKKRLKGIKGFEPK